MPQKLRYLGVPVYMNGQNFYIPSLSKRQYQENAARLAAGVPEGTPTEQGVTWFDDIILLAIQRNYPEVTADDLAEWLDLNTSTLALKALSGQSGLEAVSEGE
jgi:hypothetical protein